MRKLSVRPLEGVSLPNQLQSLPRTVHLLMKVVWLSLGLATLEWEGLVVPGMRSKEGDESVAPATRAAQNNP